ncbi:hypothetical protein BAMA_21370 [Bacillus manliponensis]|uniref:Uncharacterized protein n=1 Tax=Bacillus manliponensis TaxID=574376 RepID=A0A073KBW6_9BACI|nr:hypothetical protein BAMA_21370 [Bacillus manliponensis]
MIGKRKKYQFYIDQNKIMIYINKKFKKRDDKDMNFSYRFTEREGCWDLPNAAEKFTAFELYW